MVTLWRFFDSYDRSTLKRYQQLVKLEQKGLTGDRHPRKVFDRSPGRLPSCVLLTAR